MKAKHGTGTGADGPDCRPADEVTGRLLRAAAGAREQAYCPYSGYAVGAAILSAAGNVYLGCNVENASYSVSNCAERVALQSAVAAGEREFAAIAVVAGSVRPARPCGSCLQALAEFSPGMRIILATTGGLVEERLLTDLLPEPFKVDRGEGGPPGGRGPDVG